MFSRFFQKSPSLKQPQTQNEVQSSVSRGKFDPRVVIHYGVPSSSSILAFDRVQRLLAVGTLDGRIKVFGGDNIEGVMISRKQTPFKNLVFLENRGFLASVTNDNEIQVCWKLVTAYENGVMVLWDASEDQIVLIRGHQDIELKRKKVNGYPNDPKNKQPDDKLDHEEEDKEICSVSWASNDGSVVVVGYVDGDIMFWDLPTANSPIDQKAKNVSNNVVKTPYYCSALVCQ